MRDSQQQLVDLQNVVIKGLKNIKRRKKIKYAYPIVLEGWEGVILRELCDLIAKGDKDTGALSKYAGTTFYEKSLLLCSQEFPSQLGDILLRHAKEDAEREDG